MQQLQRMILMAEDELTEFSTEARKIEKLRRKIGLSVPIGEQRQAREQLVQELPTAGLPALVERQRQAIALPFWGIAGLGLLLAFSLNQPGDFVFTIAGAAAAFVIQKWGWRLQAKRLLVKTLDDIEQEIQRDRSV